jgi:hypothetical protein
MERKKIFKWAESLPITNADDEKAQALRATCSACGKEGDLRQTVQSGTGYMCFCVECYDEDNLVELTSCVICGNKANRLWTDEITFVNLANKPIMQKQTCSALCLKILRYDLHVPELELQNK